MTEPAIIVHGGAGTVEDERRQSCIAGCEEAARAGWQVLAGGGSALDAVEAAVRVLEDNPEYNAGYGSVLNRLGIVEVDACIMDGQLRAGAVGAVPWMRHPVTLARRLLDRGEHVLLVGGGALLFARELGISPDAPETMVAPRARARFEGEGGQSPAAQSGGTVGACAVDGAGRVAAATSTGGISGKRPGRVGDTPLVGGGTFADDEGGAASATGHGEAILRVVMTKGAIDRLRAGASADEAARAAVAEVERRTGTQVGIILVGRDGSVGHHSATPRMPWAAIAGGRPSSGAEHP
jgi:beta-aspartyl-peptidase (threonine type)